MKLMILTVTTKLMRIMCFGESIGIRTHNHSVRKWTLIHLVKLTKWLSCVMGTLSVWCIWLHVVIISLTSFSVSLHSLVLKLQIEYLLWSSSSLTFSQIIECRFTLKLEHDMIITCSQMHHTDKYFHHSSILWSVWLKGWVFVYELCGCGFKSCCSQLNFKNGTCLEQGFRWNSGKL